ncbi:MAG TPA: TonB family protein [Candidatus Angelobacter sp.]
MVESWSQWEGQVVNGELHLTKYLGGSEQSAVFLTEDHGQQAAIKLLAADPANAQRQLSRWEQAQGLSHPHLIRLLRTGRCRLGTVELIFSVMEYAEENLSQIVPERPLTPQEAREMLAPTLDALACLHGRELVHRHLKPADIMAIKDQVKIASDGLCGTGEAVSNPGKLTVYDAQEKASGESSPATDIWSLGVILAQALTQHLPSRSGKEQSDPILPENLPAPFDDIVRGCLRLDPGQRWTIAQISGRLRPTAPQPSPQERPTAAGPSMESMIRKFAFPVVAAFVSVAALFAGLGLLRRTPKAQPEVSAAKPEHQPESKGGVKPSPTTRDRQPGSASNRSSASGTQSRPASLLSETKSPDADPDVESSGVVHQVLPDVPQTASDTIQGTLKVSVIVNVDPSGNVLAAELDSPGPSPYFARLALAAAQNWKFLASNQEDVQEFVLHFEFRNSGARAFATHAGR